MYYIGALEEVKLLTQFLHKLAEQEDINYYNNTR